eukprot:gene17557-19308_t
MAEGIEIAFVGKLTYYAIVVYLLFIIGLAIVCRHRLKAGQERRSKTKRKASTSDPSDDNNSCTEKCDEHTDMGLFQSKKNRSQQSSNEETVKKRSVTKQALRNNDNRPVSSAASNNYETPADFNKARCDLNDDGNGKCNKKVNNSIEKVTDARPSEEELSIDNANSTIISNERHEVKTINVQKNSIGQEKADDIDKDQLSAFTIVENQSQAIINEADKLLAQTSSEDAGKNMGRPITTSEPKPVDAKEIIVDSIEVKKNDEKTAELRKNNHEMLEVQPKPCKNIPKSEKNSDNVDCFADKLMLEVLNDAYGDVESQLPGVKNLAETISESLMADVMSRLSDQQLLSGFASNLASRTISGFLDDKASVGLVKSESSQQASHFESKAVSTPPAPSKSSSSLSSPQVAKETTRDINFTVNSKSTEAFSEELACMILDDALDESEANFMKLSRSFSESESSGEDTAEEQSQKHSETTLLQVNNLSDKIADMVLIDSFVNIELNDREGLLNGDKENISVNESCGHSNISLSNMTKQSDINTGLNPEVDIQSEESNTDGMEKADVVSGNYEQTAEKEVKKNAVSEDKSPLQQQPPAMLRNKNLLKVKLHTDRPLSGYAEQLASFLADDDDSLDLFESDEEFDAVLDKMEQKYKDDQKLNKKIQRRRKASDSKRSDCYGVANGLRLRNRYDGYSSNEDLLSEEEERGRLASTQSESSFLSDTDTDDISRGSFSDDQLLSPGFSKFTMNSTAVIDTGCGIIKAGIAGEIAPRCMLPSIIGVPRRFSQDLSQIGRGYYVGEEAISRAGMLHIDHPIKQNVTNWSDVDSLLEYVIEVELGINIRDHPLLLTENGLISKKQREKLTEIAFERYGVPAFFLANQGPLSLYSMGLMSGLCLNAGFYATQAIPVYEGHALEYCTGQLDVGGYQISNHLGRLLLSTKGLSFSSSSERFILNIMKERIGYVAEDTKLEEMKFKKSSHEMHQIYTLPDGQEIEIGAQRYRAAEILYDPEEIGLEQKPIQCMLMDSIARADNSMQPALTNNLLVTGGTSLLPGFTSRLKNELDALTDHTAAVRLTNATNPLTATWTGGSVISSRSTFSQQCVTTDEYAEIGAHVVHTKCF